MHAPGGPPAGLRGHRPRGPRRPRRRCWGRISARLERLRVAREGGRGRAPRAAPLLATYEYRTFENPPSY